MNRYYQAGLRHGVRKGGDPEDGGQFHFGAEMMPEDPYTDLDRPATSKALGEGQNHWTQDQFRDKAKAWLSTASVDTMIVEITSNGAKLHSIPFDTGAGGDSKIEDATKAYEAELLKPASYAWIGLLSKSGGLIHDQMFASVTPLVHETTKTITVPQKGGAVAAGLSVIGALGLLFLVAKAR